jgi:AcrR family transcriptional regulator
VLVSLEEHKDRTMTPKTRGARKAGIGVRKGARGAGAEAPPTAPRAGRASGRRTRQRPSDVAKMLEKIALDLFADQNYSAVTIKDISKSTRVNASLIYYYYANKEDLFLHIVEATVERAFRKFDAIVAPVVSPEETISLWIDLHATQFILLRKLAKISLDYASTHNRTRRIDKAIREFYDRESVVLENALRTGIESGRFRPVDVRQVAIFISTFLDGTLFRSVMFPRFDFRAAIFHMQSFVLDYLASPRQQRSQQVATR